MNDAAQLTLRNASADDAGRIAAMLTDEGYPAGTTDLEARLARFEQPGARGVGGDAAGEVVGFTAFRLVPRFENDGQFLGILAGVVDRGVRERGIGRLLIAEAER